MNPLSVPRAWGGDLAVHLADSLAARGYASFRMDLPGLGDSLGNSPAALIDFVNAGGYAPILAGAIEELVQRFHVDGVVLIGHCSAVSAIYTAAGVKACEGLVLLDPYFYLVRSAAPNLRPRLTDLAARNRFASYARSLYDRARALRRTMQKVSLPENANRMLLSRWKQVASSRLPLLILKAPGLESPGVPLRPGQFAYLQHVLALAGQDHQVSLHFLDDTDHSFANRAGRDAVRSHIEHWLSSHFEDPVAESSRNS